MEAPFNAMTFTVLVKEEQGLFTAHCLELDIVAEGPHLAQVKKEMGDLIAAAVEYAFSHDNVAHLYRPAPPEVWAELCHCVQEGFDRIPVGQEADGPLGRGFVPPWVITKTCRADSLKNV